MDVQKDFLDICSLLNARGVEFVIVGGYAVAYHGAPRFTGDLDILVRPDDRQVSNLLLAIADFGFPTADLAPGYLLEHHKILQLGTVPVQIHFMTSVTGVGWDDVWSSRQPGFYGDVPVFFIGRQALIANKRSAGRMKDLADVEALEQIRA